MGKKMICLWMAFPWPLDGTIWYNLDTTTNNLRTGYLDWELDNNLRTGYLDWKLDNNVRTGYLDWELDNNLRTGYLDKNIEGCTTTITILVFLGILWELYWKIFVNLFQFLSSKVFQCRKGFFGAKFASACVTASLACCFVSARMRTPYIDVLLLPFSQLYTIAVLISICP